MGLKRLVLKYAPHWFAVLAYRVFVLLKSHGTGAYVAIFRQKEVDGLQVLLVETPEGKLIPPGGIFDPAHDVDPWATAIREVQGEVGFFVMVWPRTLVMEWFLRKPNLMCRLYRARISSKELVQVQVDGAEVVAFHWLSLEEVERDVRIPDHFRGPLQISFYEEKHDHPLSPS